jgi:hypothetical protein
VDCGWLLNGAELSTAAVGACDEPTDAVGNSGRTWEFILCGHRRCWQMGEVVLVGRGVIQAGMGSRGVVPAHVLGDIRARGADAAVGFEVHALVLHAAPQPLNEDVGASSQLRRMKRFSDDLFG